MGGCHGYQKRVSVQKDIMPINELHGITVAAHLPQLAPPRWVTPDVCRWDLASGTTQFEPHTRPSVTPW